MIAPDDSARCALCGDDTGVDLAWAAAYPGIVCTACEARAVNAAGESPEHRLAEDDGDNPVFVDEKKCWRRYREGGYVTMYDRFDCASLEAYIAKARPEAEPDDDDDGDLEDEDGVLAGEDTSENAGGVAATIAQLRNALARSASERELLGSLEAGLGRLRVLYQRDRRQFAAGDLAYLRGVASIVAALAEFIATLAASAPSRERLLAVLPILEPFAVGRRVAEELRAVEATKAVGGSHGDLLRADVPLEDTSRDDRPRNEAGRVDTPQADVPLCPDGHRMVVRRGLSGRYWECSRYPECEAKLAFE